MKGDKVRIGVIGVGAIGPSHVYSIKRTEGCALAAICDLRAEAAALITAIYESGRNASRPVPITRKGNL